VRLKKSRCFLTDPIDRPSFSELLDFISESITYDDGFYQLVEEENRSFYEEVYSNVKRYLTIDDIIPQSPSQE